MKYKALTATEEEEAKRRLTNLKEELERLNKAINISKSAKKLNELPEFREVFLEYYFKDEVIRMVNLLPEKPFLEEKERQSLTDSIVGVSTTNDWFKSQLTIESTLKNSVVSIEERIKNENTLLMKGIPNG